MNLLALANVAAGLGTYGCKTCKEKNALGQMTAESRRIAYGQTHTEAPRVALGEEGQATSRTNQSYEPGDYHIVGSGVILRALPDASSKAIATLASGETVYVWGDVETDPAHILGPNNSAIPNPDPETYAGIDYVHIGTQTHGAGWVSDAFILPGAEGAAKSAPPPEPATSLESSASAPSSKSLATTVLIGGLIGVAALGAIALAVHAAKPHRLAHV